MDSWGLALLLHNKVKTCPSGHRLANGVKVPECRHFLRNPKWGPSDFGFRKKSGDGHGLRRPTFALRPSRRALRSLLTLPRFPVLLRGSGQLENVVWILFTAISSYKVNRKVYTGWIPKVGRRILGAS